MHYKEILIAILLTPILLLSLISCSAQEKGDVRNCPPGTKQKCICDNGLAGVKTCETSGMKWGVCVCKSESKDTGQGKDVTQPKDTGQKKDISKPEPDVQKDTIKPSDIGQDVPAQDVGTKDSAQDSTPETTGDVPHQDTAVETGEVTTESDVTQNQ